MNFKVTNHLPTSSFKAIRAILLISFLVHFSVSLETSQMPDKVLLQSHSSDSLSFTSFPSNIENTTENDFISHLEPRQLSVIPEDSLLDLVQPPSSENTRTFIMFGKMVKYIAFVEITLPTRLQTFASYVRNRQSILSLQFGITFPKSSLSDIRYHTISTPFSNQAYHSNFFVNFFDGMLSLFIILCIAFLLILLEWVFKKLSWETTHKIFRMFKLLFKWNWPLLLFAIGIDDIIYCAALEFRSLTIDTPMAMVSFLCSLFAIFFVIVFFLSILYIAFDERYYDTKQGSIRGRPMDYAYKWMNMQVLFGGTKNGDFIVRAFYFFYIWRLCLSAILGACLYSYPVAQGILHVLVSMMILGLIVGKRPFRKLVNMIQVSLFELLYCAINLSLIVVASYSTSDEPQGETATAFGDIIIVLNIIINIGVIVFLAIKLILEGIEIYKIRKNNKSESWTIWFQLLTIFLEQAGLGFEEFMIVGFANDYVYTPLPVIQVSPSASPLLVSKRKKMDISLDISKISPSKFGMEMNPMRGGEFAKPLEVISPDQMDRPIWTPETPLRSPGQKPVGDVSTEVSIDQAYRILTPNRVRNRPLNLNIETNSKLLGTGKNEMRKAMGLESELDLGNKPMISPGNWSRVDTTGTGDSIEGSRLLNSQASIKNTQSPRNLWHLSPYAKSAKTRSLFSREKLKSGQQMGTSKRAQNHLLQVSGLSLTGSQNLASSRDLGRRSNLVPHEMVYESPLLLNSPGMNSQMMNSNILDQMNEQKDESRVQGSKGQLGPEYDVEVNRLE